MFAAGVYAIAVTRPGASESQGSNGKALGPAPVAKSGDHAQISRIIMGAQVGHSPPIPLNILPRVSICGAISSLAYSTILA